MKKIEKMTKMEIADLLDEIAEVLDGEYCDWVHTNSMSVALVDLGGDLRIKVINEHLDGIDKDSTAEQIQALLKPGFKLVNGVDTADDGWVIEGPDGTYTGPTDTPMMAYEEFCLNNPDQVKL